MFTISLKLTHNQVAAGTKFQKHKVNRKKKRVNQKAEKQIVNFFIQIQRMEYNFFFFSFLRGLHLQIEFVGKIVHKQALANI